MKILAVLSLTLVAFGLSACENATATNAVRIANERADASGSPFRWKTQNVSDGTAMFLTMVDLPSGPSKADPTLKQDILALISKAEATKGRTDPQVEDVKRMNDGREIWILKSKDKQSGIAYIVSLKPSPHGGTDIGLNGPTGFHK
jgi:hypothetical protein